MTVEPSCVLLSSVRLFRARTFACTSMKACVSRTCRSAIDNEEDNASPGPVSAEQSSQHQHAGRQRNRSKGKRSSLKADKVCAVTNPMRLRALMTHRKIVGDPHRQVRLDGEQHPVAPEGHQHDSPNAKC